MDDARLKIVLHCTDVAASRRFYGDVLGLALVDEWQESHGAGCLFAVGQGFLELGERRHDDGAPRAATFDIQFAVPDLDKCLQRIDGRWDHEPVKTQPWGERTMRMRDPDGTTITIYEEAAE